MMKVSTNMVKMECAGQVPLNKMGLPEFIDKEPRMPMEPVGKLSEALHDLDNQCDCLSNRVECLEEILKGYLMPEEVQRRVGVREVDEPVGSPVARAVFGLAARVRCANDRLGWLMDRLDR